MTENIKTSGRANPHQTVWKATDNRLIERFSYVPGDESPTLCVENCFRAPAAMT